MWVPAGRSRRSQTQNRCRRRLGCACSHDPLGLNPDCLEVRLLPVLLVRPRQRGLHPLLARCSKRLGLDDAVAVALELGQPGSGYATTTPAEIEMALQWSEARCSFDGGDGAYVSDTSSPINASNGHNLTSYPPAPSDRPPASECAPRALRGWRRGSS